MHQTVNAENVPFLQLALARGVHLMDTDPQVRATASSAQQLRDVAGDGRRSCIELVAAACEVFSERPYLAMRQSGQDYTTLSYAQLWQRILRMAGGAQALRLYDTGEFVGILGFASTDWIVSDLSCLYLCAVSVPLRTSMAPNDFCHVINQAGLKSVFCSAEQLPGLVEMLPQCPSIRSIVLIDSREGTASPDVPGCRVYHMAEVERVGATQWVDPVIPDAKANPLVSLCYTSGSTALPKGAMLTESVWRHTFTGAMFTSYPDLPGITFNYTPLNHIAGRNNTYRELVRGGLVYFAQKSDMSTLFEDIRLARPLYFMAVPRVTEMVYQQYQAACLQADAKGCGRDEVLSGMRHFFGDRLCVLNTGTAPSPGEVLDFCRACFQVPIVDGYGSTENGVVAFENRIVRPIVDAYALRDVPELGYRTTDKPYPRGELCVKSTRVIPGYYKDPVASAKLHDGVGWMLTGDIVEERGPDHIVWIDRRHNIMKLSQGEFVSASHLEAVFMGGGAFIEQIYVYVNSYFAYPLAVVVPNQAAVQAHLGEHASPADVKQLIRQNMERVAAEARLQSFELPRDFIVETVLFTQGNGLLTESAKPSRPNLRSRYGEQLDALYQQNEQRTLEDEATLGRAGDLTLCEKVRRAAAVSVGLDKSQVDVDVSFRRLGGDSLTAVRLSGMLKQLCGSAPPVALILDPFTSLIGLSQWIENGGAPQVGFSAIHGMEPQVVRAQDVNIDAFVAPLPTSAEHILLTGGTGFLGRFLLLELLQRAKKNNAKVTCLVRAGDDAGALQRLRQGYACSGPALTALFDAHASHLDAFAGDFMQPHMGLGAHRYLQLSQSVDAVLHNGALVNHALSYSQLFEPNVLGTVEMMSFAMSGRRKALSFLSTTGVLNGLEHGASIGEDEPVGTLWPERALAGSYASGYCTSKWASEILLKQLAERYAIPVKIFRSGLILGHTSYLGQINATDFFTRLLHGLVHTGLAPRSFYKSADDVMDFDALPVDFVAAQIAAISCAVEPGLHTYNVIGPCEEARVSLDNVVEWVESAGYKLVRKTDYHVWYKDFSAALSQLGEGVRAASPWPILSNWKLPQSWVSAPDTRNFRAAIRQHGTRQPIPRVDEAFVHHSLQHMKHLGLI